MVICHIHVVFFLFNRHSYGRSPFLENEVKVVYWQEGILADYESGVVVIESALYHTPPGSHDTAGVVISVRSHDMNATGLAFAVDQIESLISQWYSGRVESSTAAT